MNANNFRYMILMVLAFLTLLLVGNINAQDTSNIPPEIDAAMRDLSERTGDTITFQTLSSFTWEARQYSDTSLGCPQPDQTYAQVITPGYQFTLSYAGTAYDYRVSEGGDTVILCETAPASVDPLDPQTCGDTYTVENGDTLFQIANRCNTTIEALLQANPDIEDRAVIYPGQELNIPESVDDIELLPTPTPLNGQTLSIEPRTGPAGTEVTLEGAGFPPNTEVEIGLGPWASEYSIIDSATTDAEGNLTLIQTIPDYVDPGDRWLYAVVIGTEETLSGTFHVTGAVQPTPIPTPTPSQAMFDRANVYLVGLNTSNESGETFGCGDSLVAVEVTFAPTIAPLTAALEQLFEIERFYGQSGLYNALASSNLSVQGIDIDNGAAQINLTGTLRLGGACDNPRVEAQIRQTALQYATIDSVTININGESIETVLSGR